MTPIRRNQNWLPNLFNDFFDNDWMVKANTTAPAINVIENEKSYNVEIAAPGMTKEDFKITLDTENNLIIEMEKKNENNTESENGKKYLRREFSYSKFTQSFLLPEDVEKDKISAKMENGVLDIEIPKMTQEMIEKASKCIEIR